MPQEEKEAGEEGEWKVVGKERRGGESDACGTSAAHQALSSFILRVLARTSHRRQTKLAQNIKKKRRKKGKKTKKRKKKRIRS